MDKKRTRIFLLKTKNKRLFADFYYLWRKKQIKMEKKIPLNIGLEILENPDIVRFNEFRFISPHFGFVNSFAKIESNLITIDQPYRIKEGRIAVIKQGYARVLINLIEETFQPDKLLLIVPNSILQIIEVSPDFDMQMVGMDALSAPDRLKLEAARSIREDFLHQNAFHETDTYTSLNKQYRMMDLILDYYRKAGKALENGVPIEALVALPVRENIGRFKYVEEADVDRVFEETENLLNSQLRDELARKEDF